MEYAKVPTMSSPQADLPRIFKISCIVLTIIYGLLTVLIYSWVEIGAIILSCDPKISWFFFVVLSVLLLKYVLIASYVITTTAYIVKLPMISLQIWRIVMCIGSGIMLALSVLCMILMGIQKQPTILIFADPYTLDMLGSFVCSAICAVYLFLTKTQQ